ncbi:MAG TPA: glycosyltransferase family 39 protein [Vicinamibacterales bacterium]|nr:glycosyltransferase family 39 protein [Vicinamibacterales bacterium]
MRSFLVAGVLATVVALALYGYRLGDTPAYLGLDEAHFANHAHSIATTARDLNGNRLPLFISLEDPLGDRPTLPWGVTWYHPYGVYLIAAALTMAPLSEGVIRAPFVALAALNLCLIYLVTWRWYHSRALAAAAGGLLALTPAHFILSRLALDYVLPLPFTLAWMYCVTSVLRQPTRRIALITGLVLGLGCFSYVSSWLMMPAYLAISLAVIVRQSRRDLLMPLVTGFVLPLLLLVPWVMFHPEMPGNVVAQYQAGEARRSVVSALLAGDGVAMAVRDAMSAYWSYFDPSFLFVSGGASRLVSTGSIGVWPIGVAVLMAIGVIRVLRRLGEPWVTVVFVGFVLAPLPAALKGEPFAIQRAISLLPFGVLLAVEGLAGAARGTAALRVIAILAIATLPLQFAGFVRHYFDGYRPQAARALDPTAFPETARVLIEQWRANGEPALAITAPLYDVSAKWRFYAIANGHEAALARTTYFNGDLSELREMPRGTLAVVETATFTPSDRWTIVARPASVFGETPLTVLRRE